LSTTSISQSRSTSKHTSQKNPSNYSKSMWRRGESS
jgi:hypothetical protein